MKNQTRIAELALHNWYVSYAEYCDKFGRRCDIDDHLDVVSTKSKGPDLYIFTNQTLSRQIESESRSYELDGIGYPAECYTPHELGKSIYAPHNFHLSNPIISVDMRTKQVKNHTPVVSLEERDTHIAKDREIYRYYRVIRAIVRYSGQVTRIIDGKEWMCSIIGNKTYLVLSPKAQYIVDELSESICPESTARSYNDAIELESDITALNRAEGKADLMKTEKYLKMQQVKTVRRTHIRPNRIEKVPFETCVVYPKK